MKRQINRSDGWKGLIRWEKQPKIRRIMCYVKDFKKLK